MTTKTYRVARAMTSNGKDFARGDKREMTEVDAAELVAGGALVEVKAAAKPADKAPANKSKGK